MWSQHNYPQNSPLPPEKPPGGGGGVDFKNKNSHPNRVYTPSASLIALKMWPQPTYPKNIRGRFEFNKTKSIEGSRAGHSKAYFLSKCSGL